MKKIDIHSHWGTRRGYTLRTPEELAQQKRTWNSEPAYATEDEMADYFRRSDVKVVLDFGFTKTMPIGEIAAVHDYGFATERAHPDAILGHWLHIDPHTGADGVRELRRCIDAAPGFLGFAVSGSGSGPASDPVWTPFYRLCIESRIPVWSSWEPRASARACPAAAASCSTTAIRATSTSSPRSSRTCASSRRARGGPGRRRRSPC